MKTLILLLLVPTLSFAKGFVPNSFSANFEESHLSQTGSIKSTYGKIDYKFPGHLRFEVTKPNPTLLVVNPKKSWHYQPAFDPKKEKDQVHVQKSSNLPIIKFLDSVKNGIDSSKLFTTKYNKDILTLSFVKTIQQEMGFVEVILHAGQGKEAKSIKELAGFEKITLVKIDKTKINLILSDIKENVAFPPGNFEFKPSANMKVIESK